RDWRAPARVDWVGWHPAGKLLATSSDDSNIFFWDLETRRQVLALRGSRTGSIVGAFSSDGELFASCGWERVLRLWDARTGDEVLQTRPALPWPLQFSPPTAGAEGHVLGRLSMATGRKVGAWEVTLPRTAGALTSDRMVREAHYGSPAFS